MVRTLTQSDYIDRELEDVKPQDCILRHMHGVVEMGVDRSWF